MTAAVKQNCISFGLLGSSVWMWMKLSVQVIDTNPH